MNDSGNDQTQFQELLDSMNINIEASEQETATMRGSLHSLSYVPYKQYANKQTTFQTLFFEYSVKINFPCVQFNVAIKQRDDFEPAFWDWKQDSRAHLERAQAQALLPENEIADELSRLFRSGWSDDHGSGGSWRLPCFHTSLSAWIWHDRNTVCQVPWQDAVSGSPPRALQKPGEESFG
jgi:hypothetical protein